MLAASVWRPGGIPARALAVHGIARLGLPLALYGGQANARQVQAALDGNRVPALDAGGFLGVLCQRPLAKQIQGMGYTIIDGPCVDGR